MQHPSPNFLTCERHLNHSADQNASGGATKTGFDFALSLLACAHIFQRKTHYSMKKLKHLPLAIALLLSACNPAEKPSPIVPVEADTTAAAKAKFPVHCYEQRFPDGSVLSFQYTEYYERIVGILDYSFAEKDGAHGTLKGTKDGDLITATWSYTVEGSNQEEVVLFKIEGDKALKASGELMEEADGTLVLKDPTTATWEETFKQVECD